MTLPNWMRPHPDDKAFAGDEPVGDCLCSRCLQPIGEREVPIWFWAREGNIAWRYHPECLGMQTFDEDESDDGWFEGIEDEDDQEWVDEVEDEEVAADSLDPQEEFKIAFNKLAQDPQLIHLELAKYQGWCLLSAVQLAAAPTLRKNSETIKAAERIVRKLEKLIVGDSPRFALVAKAGWNREEVQVPVEEVIAVMTEQGNDVIQFEMSKVSAWCLVCTVQVAVRHPEFKDSSVGKAATDMAMQLQPAIASEGILAIALHAGWDTRFDQP